MNKGIMLSVVIPCYNSYKYMKTLLSHFEQMANPLLQIVIVDDCSTDSSYEDLLQYKSKSNISIKLLKNEKNSGPGISRNKGIEYSDGKYITFLDSDDYFDLKYWEIVYPLLKNDYEVIVYDAVIDCLKGKQIEYFMFSMNQKKGDIQTSEALVFIKGATWGKIYKKELIRDHNIIFPDLKRNEDMPFTKSVIAVSKRIYYLKECLYHYVQHNDSLMYNAELLDVKNAQTGFFLLNERFKFLYPKEMEAIFAVEYLYSTIFTNIQKMKRKQLINYIKESEKIYPKYITNSYLKKFPVYIKISLYLIRWKMYYPLRGLFLLKKKIRG